MYLMFYFFDFLRGGRVAPFAPDGVRLGRGRAGGAGANRRGGGCDGEVRNIGYKHHSFIRHKNGAQIKG